MSSPGNPVRFSCSPVSFSGREQEPAAALEHRRPPLGGELPGVGNGSSSDKSRDARARSRRPGRQPRAAGAERSDAP